MRQYVESETQLEMRGKTPDGEWWFWAEPSKENYREARMLASQGRVIEAIESAVRSWLERYPGVDGAEFRCVTRTRAVTSTVPLSDGWNA